MGQHPVSGGRAAPGLLFLFLALWALAACGRGAGPEAGPMAGDGVIRYVALGDSLAAGSGAEQGYVERYAAALVAGTDAEVTVANLGVPGWTSDDLLAALRTDPAFQEAVQGADVVTWDIGGNDALITRARYRLGLCGGPDNQACLRSGLERFRRNWDAILAELLRLRPEGAVLLTMDLYNPFAAQDRRADSWPNDGGATDLEVFAPYLEAMNRHIQTTAEAAGVRAVRLSRAFNGDGDGGAPATDRYLAPDGIHPNDAGHAVIARLLAEAAAAPTA